MYVVKDWDKYYENNRSRDIKAPQWVPIPNKHDGDGYTQLMEQDDSGAMYGAWIAIIALASKCDNRGTLLRSDGTPHDVASISRITRINKASIQKTLDFCTHSLKWLIYMTPQEGAGLPQEGVLNGREWKGTEGNGNEPLRADDFANEYKHIKETPEKPLTDIERIEWVIEKGNHCAVRTLADELGYGTVVGGFANKAPDLKGECYRTFLERLMVMLKGKPDAKTSDAVEYLVDLVKSWAGYWKKKRTETKYIPSIANFFNGSKYTGFPE